MNQCALCMTELHLQAVVCVGCGASKGQVRKKAGFLRGLGILGLSIIAILLLMPGRFMAGFIVPSLPEDLPAPRPPRRGPPPRRQPSAGPSRRTWGAIVKSTGALGNGTSARVRPSGA